MLLVKIMGVWAVVGSDLGNIPLMQVLGLTINLLGGLGQGICPLSVSSSVK